MSIGDIDLFEVNEAFAAVVLRFLQAFDVDPAKVLLAGFLRADQHRGGAVDDARRVAGMVDVLDRLDDRPGRRDAQGTGARRDEHRRHRPVRGQRGLRGGGDEGGPLARPLQLVEHGAEDHRAGGAERVAERDDVTRKVLARAGMSIGDIDLFEVNEAFAAVVLRFLRARGFRPAFSPASCEPISTAAAPSTMPDELPAWWTCSVRDVNGLTLLDHDEHRRPSTDMQSLGSLKPSFVQMGQMASAIRPRRRRTRRGKSRTWWRSGRPRRPAA
jgi:hypothetical protein